MDDATTIPGRNQKMAAGAATPGSWAATTEAWQAAAAAADTGVAAAKAANAANAADVAAGWVPAQPRARRIGDPLLVTTRRLPRAHVVERDEFLLGAAAGRVVTHVGFAATDARDNGRHDGHGRHDDRGLHAGLAAVTRALVGVDTDQATVAQARAAGFECHAVDGWDPAAISRAAIRPAELLVVSEVIEYVDGVGAFLDGMRALTTPDGTMIITVSNAFRLMSLAATLTGRELVRPGQVARYSWYTLANVLERHSWRVVAFHPYETSDHATRRAARLVRAAERVARPFAPFLTAGLVAVCRQAPIAG